MKLTELFTQPDAAFGNAMNIMLAHFHHSDDSQAPYQRDQFTYQLDQSRMPAVDLSIESYLARLAILPVPLTSPRHATWAT